MGLGVLVALILLANAPILHGVPGVDSGMYAYAGWRILEGELPYREVWDHKPPGIYYLDALGLRLSRLSFWGIWSLELVSLYGAAILGYWGLRRVWGSLPALLASVIWLLSLNLVLAGGNRPEEFGLPLSFAALALFIRGEEVGHSAWRTLLIGMMGGLASCLKPTLIGVWLALVVVILWAGVRRGQWRTATMSVATILGGATLFPAMAVGYFVAQGALPEMADSLISFNLAYASRPLVQHLQAPYAGMIWLAPSGVAMVGVAAWLSGSAHLLRGVEISGTSKALLQVALVGLPIEMALSAVSGAAFAHYYVIWLPVLAVLTAWAAATLLNTAGSTSPLLVRVSSSAAIWAVAFALAMSAVPGLRLVGALVAESQVSQSRSQTVSEAVAYIRRHSQPADSVLVWGRGTGVNFLARRRSPVRFSYQYPLYWPGYERPALAQEFVDQLAAERPVLVVDNLSGPASSGPRSFAARQQAAFQQAGLELPSNLARIAGHIDLHYRFVTQVGAGEWAIYECVTC